MKDIEQLRSELIDRIDKGANAKHLLKQLDPLFVELREYFRGELVNSVRSKAEDREIVLNSCKITALEELYNLIYQQAVTGARAQEKATQIEEEANES